MTLFDRFKAVFFIVKATGWARKFLLVYRHAGNFHNGSIRRQIAAQTHHTTGRGDRIIGRANHVLIGVPFHGSEVFRNGAASHRHAIPVQIAMVEQSFHEQRNTAHFKHVLGDIATTRLQIGDIGRLFEDFRDIEQSEFNACFMGNGGQMQSRIG